MSPSGVTARSAPAWQYGVMGGRPSLITASSGASAPTRWCVSRSRPAAPTRYACISRTSASPSWETPRTADAGESRRAALAAELRAFPRQALHAARLSLSHPLTHREHEWRSPLPADMQRLLAALEADR